jgi:murein L,D-transpeptidase YcbB/YkuD
VLWGVLGGAADARAATASEELRQALGRPGPLRVDGRALDPGALRAFYQRRGFQPVWSGEPGAAGRLAALLAALEAAPAHGLDPTEYHLAAARRRAVGAPGASGAPGAPPVDSELLLSDALLRYATHVRVGRVRPAAAGHDRAFAPDPFDAAEAAAQALDGEDLGAWLAGLPPPAPGYRALAAALARHLAAARSALAPIELGPPLRPGIRDDRVPLLRRRLSLEDDSLGPATDDLEFEPDLERALKAFQQRHALAPDGMLGPATRTALNAPLAPRLRQLVLNLERWRWLPRTPSPRVVVVNVAAATVALVEADRETFRARAVVGDPLHPTPLLRAELDALVLNPVWNVPESIVIEEFLPKLRQNPRFLADNDMVILGAPPGDPHGLQVDWASQPARPDLRLQQRAGPWNPLGRLKFDMPNRFEVYLHDTPLPELFEREDRTLSHGCVRVERALELAARLLGDQPLGAPGALERAIARGAARRLRLTEPVPVHLVYFTAFVRDGELHWAADPYDHDPRLGQALARRAGRRPGPARPAPGARAG